MRFDKEKKNFLAEIYHKLKKFRLVQRAWLSSFKNGRVPTPGTIKNTLDRFYKTGSVASLPLLWVQPIKKREDTKNQQKAVFLKNPSLSVRKASAYTGIRYDMVQSILREDLHIVSKDIISKKKYRFMPLPLGRPINVNFEDRVLKPYIQNENSYNI